MINERHLDEDERQGLAEGSLPSDRFTTADAHLRACLECSADVERIRKLMKRAELSKSRETANRAEVDAAWSSIRARIEQRKVVAMPAGSGISDGDSATGTASLSRRWLLAIGGVVAAGLLVAFLVRPRPTPIEPSIIAEVNDSGVSLIAVMDSANAYQEEAQALLNRLELQRATLRPELARALERDLRTIDLAIAELQGAIRTDPANPALRRLLASSYRQKVDLLKRVSNAS